MAGMYPPGHPGNPTDVDALKRELAQTMMSGGAVGDAMGQFGGDLGQLAGQAGSTTAGMGQDAMGQMGQYADTAYDQAQSMYGQAGDAMGQMAGEVEAYSSSILDQIASAPGEVQGRLKEALRGWLFEDTGGLPVNVNVREPGGFQVTP